MYWLDCISIEVFAMQSKGFGDGRLFAVLHQAIDHSRVVWVCP